MSTPADYYDAKSREARRLRERIQAVRDEINAKQEELRLLQIELERAEYVGD